MANHRFAMILAWSLSKSKITLIQDDCAAKTARRGLIVHYMLSQL